MKLIIEACNRKRIIDVNNANKMGKLFAAVLDDNVETVTITKKGNDKESVYKKSDYERLEEELKISMKYWKDTEVNFLLKREQYNGIKEGFLIGAITALVAVIATTLAL